MSKPMSVKTKSREMGKSSNLITDMAIKRASDEELTRAIKHSMIVMAPLATEDEVAKSEKENRIDELRTIYSPKRP
jgi:hypothetical protein